MLVFPKLEFDKLDEFLQEFEFATDQEVSAGVAVEGPAAGYALVWEWGNARQEKKGPKTVMGVNADGQHVWLSIQAPKGYIRIGESQYWEILDQELKKITFSGETAAEMIAEIERCASRVAKRVAKVVQSNAPVDSGDLRDSIVPVEPDDPLLSSEEGEETDEYETMFLEE